MHDERLLLSLDDPEKLGRFNTYQHPGRLDGLSNCGRCCCRHCTCAHNASSEGRTSYPQFYSSAREKSPAVSSPRLISGPAAAKWTFARQASELFGRRLGKLPFGRRAAGRLPSGFGSPGRQHAPGHVRIEMDSLEFLHGISTLDLAAGCEAARCRGHARRAIHRGRHRFHRLPMVLVGAGAMSCAILPSCPGHGSQQEPYASTSNAAAGTAFGANGRDDGGS